MYGKDLIEEIHSETQDETRFEKLLVSSFLDPVNHYVRDLHDVFVENNDFNTVVAENAGNKNSYVLVEIFVMMFNHEIESIKMAYERRK